MSTSVLIARLVLAELALRGLDGEALLLRSELSRSRLADLHRMLSIDELDLLAREALLLTEDPALGLSMGKTAPLSGLQLLGHLVLAQRTLREAFDVLQRYLGLLVRGPCCDLIEIGPLACFTCEPQVQLGSSTRFAVEFALALTARIGSHFLGQDTWLHRVEVQHAEPEHAERYRELFKCPVLFSQSKNSVAFPRELLDQRQLYADDMMHAALVETADRFLAEQLAYQSVSERVRTVLRYERDLQDVSLEGVARRFGLSTRSLRRRLSAEGVTLSQLLDEARRVLSFDELRRPDATIKDTATRVGFSEPSAFHRAFRRWTGLTPLEYVRVHRPSEAPIKAPSEADAMPAFARRQASL